jgi:hypothetical protein
VGVKRPLLGAALLLATGMAWSGARADEGAYASLVGMARSASADLGPDAGPSSDGPAARPPAAPAPGESLKDAVAQPPSPRAVSAAASRPGGAPAAGPVKTRAEDGVRPAASAPGPRLWNRHYATLLPSWRPGPAPLSSFRAPASTAAFRGAPLPIELLPSNPDEVRAGESRGLAELLSSSAAPADLK